MILFKRAGDLAAWLAKERKGGKTVGFVPTMGALHAGHISLIDISKRSSGVTVCSIFVNPTQFNDPKDFQKYPVTLEKDIYLLETAGTDALFLPEVDEVYPDGTKGLETYDLGRLESLLEGKYRPGHFQGVCQVMRRLMDLVGPDDLFMGQKDYQQCMVIARLLVITGMSTRLHPCPIIRETDGLAMSSRNLRLPPEDRKKAPAIYRALELIRNGLKAAVTAQSVDRLMAEAGRIEAVNKLMAGARSILEENGFRIDYIALADAVTLEPGDSIVLVAAFLGEIRLIDNMLL